MTKSGQKLHVFICYASQDKPIAQELSQRLMEESWIDPWLDKQKLHPGEDWRTSIEEAVEAADVVMICLSNNSVNKEGFVQKELRYAREISLEKPEGTLFLIPIRLDECVVPRGLRFIQWVDYFGEEKEESFIALLESFRIRYKQVIRREIGQTSLKNREYISEQDLQPIRNVSSDYYERIGEMAKQPNAIYGIPTGFIDIDRMINGLQPSNLYVIAGRPGQGKASFLLSVAKNAALLYKKHVAVFLPLGMSNEQVLLRLITSETAIDFGRLRTGKLEESEWPSFLHAIETITDSNIFLDDTAAITLRQLREKSRRQALEGQLDLIIIENPQFMGGEENIITHNKDLNYINLKVLARELNVPILAAVDLGRTVEQRVDKRPVLSDLLI